MEDFCRNREKTVMEILHPRRVATNQVDPLEGPHLYIIIGLFSAFDFLCRRIKKKCIFAASLKSIIMSEEILQKVQSIIADKLSVDVADVTPEKSFTNDLGADSLDTVELIMEFENAFGIKFPEEDAEKIATVGDAVAYIENLLASK